LILIAAATNATTTGGGHGSAFPSILFFLVLAFAVMWLIVIRPQRRKQKLQQGMQSELAVGDEVLTAGGVYGKVTRIDDDEVGVEIAPNVEVNVQRTAIAQLLPKGTIKAL
jgi:preprotein translocase subunit YajC